jgi:hypothetical protein
MMRTMKVRTRSLSRREAGMEMVGREELASFSGYRPDAKLGVIF